MKITKGIMPLVVFGAIIFTSSAFAYSSKTVDYGCKDPKFKSFFPAKRKNKEPVPEVESGSEISFTVSGGASKYSIMVTIKRQKIKPVVVDKQSFYKVSAKIPVELNDEFARIDIWAKSKDGLCSSKDGWLIKIKKSVNEAEATAVPKPELVPVPVED